MLNGNLEHRNIYGNIQRSDITLSHGIVTNFRENSNTQFWWVRHVDRDTRKTKQWQERQWKCLYVIDHWRHNRELTNPKRLCKLFKSSINPIPLAFWISIAVYNHKYIKTYTNFIQNQTANKAIILTLCSWSQYRFFLKHQSLNACPFYISWLLQ